MPTSAPESPEGGNESDDGPSSSPAAIYAELCNERGVPMPSKDATKRAIAALIEDKRPAEVNVFGSGPLLLSNVPKSSVAENAEVVLGIE